MPFISSFETISVAVLEQYIFFWIPKSIVDAAADLPYGPKIFFAKGTATFINGQAILLNNVSKKPPD